MKEQLLKCCDELMAVVDRQAVEYGDDLAGRIAATKKRIEDYVFRIYIVGPFSCGKSSMLNRWLGQKLLVTGSDPTTAVSTELRYSENERIDLYPINNPDVLESTMTGPVKKSLAMIHDRANNEELANVVVYLNNPQLKRYSDLSIVDMPGLESANRTHEVAINRFIQEANPVGIFCIDVADGTPRASCLDFIRNMNGYRGRFNLLLTKADGHLPSDCESARQCCCQVIGDLIGEEVNCGMVSLDSVDDLTRMFDSFVKDKDAYLLDFAKKEISYLVADIEKPLRRALSAKFDRSAVERALGKIEETKQSIPDMVGEIKRDMESSLSSASSEVMEKVRSAANGQRAACVQGLDSAAGSLRSAIENAISFAVPMVVGKAVSESNRQADKFFDDNLDIQDIPGGDIVDIGDGSDGNLMPVDAPQFPVEKKSGFDMGAVFSTLNGDMGLSPMTLGLGCAGEMLLGAIGLGPLGFVAGAAASFFISHAAEEQKRADREAECDRMIQSTVENVRSSVDKALAAAKDKYAEKLKAVAEKRVAILEEQMLQLKNESAADEAGWNARQQVRQQDLDRVEKLYKELGVA